MSLNTVKQTIPTPIQKYFKSATSKFNITTGYRMLNPNRLLLDSTITTSLIKNEKYDITLNPKSTKNIKQRITIPDKFMPQAFTLLNQISHIKFTNECVYDNQDHYPTSQTPITIQYTPDTIHIKSDTELFLQITLSDIQDRLLNDTKYIPEFEHEYIKSFPSSKKENLFGILAIYALIQSTKNQTDIIYEESIQYNEFEKTILSDENQDLYNTIKDIYVFLISVGWKRYRKYYYTRIISQ